MRTMGWPRRPASHASPASGPMYRWIDASYSGDTSSRWSVSAVPRRSRALNGNDCSLSIVTATRGSAASALSLGARTGVPITTASPVQWNPMGTTRGVPSVQV